MFPLAWRVGRQMLAKGRFPAAAWLSGTVTVTSVSAGILQSPDTGGQVGQEQRMGIYYKTGGESRKRAQGIWLPHLCP